MFRPFRADLLRYSLPNATLHGFTVALCPGLICFDPFGARNTLETDDPKLIAIPQQAESAIDRKYHAGDVIGIG